MTADNPLTAPIDRALSGVKAPIPKVLKERIIAEIEAEFGPIKVQHTAVWSMTDPPTLDERGMEHVVSRGLRRRDEFRSRLVSEWRAESCS